MRRCRFIQQVVEKGSQLFESSKVRDRFGLSGLRVSRRWIALQGRSMPAPPTMHKPHRRVRIPIERKISKLHGSARGILAPLAIVAESACLVWMRRSGARFCLAVSVSAPARKESAPVCDCALRATCSGVPVAMILPPWSPPSGPRIDPASPRI